MEQAIKTKRKKVGRTVRNEILGVGLAGLPILGYFLFGVIPIIFAFVMSFMKIKGFVIDERASFVMFDNYKEVLTDPVFFKSLGVTFYAALGLPISLVLSLIIATLLSKNIKGKKFYRTVFFVPFVCSMVALSLMWKHIFGETYGVLNSFIRMMGGTPIAWLKEERLMPSMIVMGVWGGMGFNIILYTAALTNVNSAYYEAAEIDGAGPFRKFFNITLPAISPTTFYLLVMGLIGALQDFTRFQVMTGTGGAEFEGLTVVFYITNYVMGGAIAGGGNYEINMGRAATASLILAAIIGLVTFINFRVSKKWVSYD